MNFNDTIIAIEGGLKVRLPEWRGYWFKSENGEYTALTKEGDFVPAWKEDKGIRERTDWEIANGLDFGWAICALKAGKLVTRKGWNGKGMFVFMRPGDALPEKFIIENVKSLPQSLKVYYKNNPVEWDNGGDIRFTPYLCMKNAQGEIMNGWAATQTDMLAEDWQLFEY